MLYRENKSCKNHVSLTLKKKKLNEPTLIFTLMGNGDHDKRYVIINSMFKYVLLCKSYNLEFETHVDQ